MGFLNEVKKSYKVVSSTPYKEMTESAEKLASYSLGVLWEDKTEAERAAILQRVSEVESELDGILAKEPALVISLVLLRSIHSLNLGIQERIDKQRS